VSVIVWNFQPNMSTNCWISTFIMPTHTDAGCMKFSAKYVHKMLNFNFYHAHTQMHRQWASYNLLDPSLVSWSKIGNLNMDWCIKSHFTSISSSRFYYAALLPRRGPHIASHSVCPSLCPSVPLYIVTERHVAPPSELQWYTCTFRLALRAAHRTAISGPHKLV